MRLVAHRGFAGLHAENTLGAFRAAAVEAGAVEFDVRRCASGDVVVFHDATVDRVTGATGRVDDYDVDALAGLDVLESGEGVPTLRRALDAIPASVAVNVEFKERGLAADALALAADADNEVFVSSFDREALAEARAADPDVTRAYLFDSDSGESLATARELDCEYVHPEKWLCLRSRVVRRAHAAGMRVNAWTVDRRIGARMLGRVGVDGVIADRPVVENP